jgi:hypothetical protein
MSKKRHKLLPIKKSVGTADCILVTVTTKVISWARSFGSSLFGAETRPATFLFKAVAQRDKARIHDSLADDSTGLNGVAQPFAAQVEIEVVFLSQLGIDHQAEKRIECTGRLVGGVLTDRGFLSRDAVIVAHIFLGLIFGTNQRIKRHLWGIQFGDIDHFEQVALGFIDIVKGIDEKRAYRCYLQCTQA